jgi:hypothetical protein
LQISYLPHLFLFPSQRVRTVLCLVFVSSNPHALIPSFAPPLVLPLSSIILLFPKYLSTISYSPLSLIVFYKLFGFLLFSLFSPLWSFPYNLKLLFSYRFTVSSSSNAYLLSSLQSSSALKSGPGGPGRPQEAVE